VLKQQIEALKTELSETKELIAALQNLTMDNSNKILAFNSIFNVEGQEGEEFVGELVDELVVDELVDELVDGGDFEESADESVDGPVSANLEGKLESGLEA
jgi:hypothetical protein